MKNKSLLMILALAPICLAGCKKNGEEQGNNDSNKTIEGVNLPTAPIEQYTAGESVILPSEGSEATSPLEISTSYTYFKIIV